MFSLWKNDFWNHGCLGLQLGKPGRYAGLINICCLVLCLVFLVPEADAQQIADQYFYKAIGLYLNGDLEQSMLELMEVLKINPEHEKAQNLLEIVLKERGWIKETKTPSGEKKKLYSMDFKDVDLGNVLRIFAQESGSNIVAGTQIQGKVTVSFKDVSLDEALNSILKVNGYDYIKEGKIIRIVSGGEATGETASQVFRLKYAAIAQVAAEVTKLLTATGKILSDTQANSIMVIDLPKIVEKVADYIDKIDTKRTQVMIEAKLIETVLNNTERLGVNWTVYAGISGAARQTIIPFKRKEDLSIYPKTNPTDTDMPQNEYVPFADPAEFMFGTINFQQTQAVLEALSTRSNTEMLSNPRVATVDSKPAKIHVGDTVPIPKYERNKETGMLEITGYDEVEVGITLEVTPRISQEGFIIMDIKPEVSTITGYTGPNNERPITSERTAETTVMIKNGETVIIGGLIKDNKIKAVRKVPLLGDLPILKYAFKYKSDQVERTELLVFITPNIMTEPL